MIRIVSLYCRKCGSAIDIDAKNLQTHCPFCGGALLIPVEQMMDILDEKKEIKQKGVKYVKDVELKRTKMEKKENSKFEWLWLVLSILILCALFFLKWKSLY